MLSAGRYDFKDSTLLFRGPEGPLARTAGGRRVVEGRFWAAARPDRRRVRGAGRGACRQHEQPPGRSRRRRTRLAGPLRWPSRKGRGRSSGGAEARAGGAEAGRPGGVGRGRAAQRPSLRTVPFTATRPRTQDRHLASAHRRPTPPSLLPLSARLVVAEGRARRLFRPSQGCTITPAAGPSRQPRRPGDPALPRAGKPGQARPWGKRLSRTK